MADITFHVDIHEEPDGSLWAQVKELPGCFASGFSMDELQEALFEAMQMWLPEGINLGDPQWKLVEEKASSGRSKKTAVRREMLVCA
jgi:predicted RNase H-like HicB family nuclease